MTYKNFQQDIAREISLYDIRSYMKLKGWKESSLPNNKLILLKGPENDSGVPLKIFLPVSLDFDDSLKRIYDVFLFLSSFYSIEPDELFRAINGLNRDKLLIAINQKDNFPASIPLKIAGKEIFGISNLFIYSACSEKSNLPHYARALPVGDNIVEKIRFGHTFRGSFGFSIESPVYGNLEFEQKDMFQAPIERRVIERIIRGVCFMSDAILNKNHDIIIKNYRTGFNSRMCEAIVEMGERLESPFKLSVQWATSLMPSQDIQNFSSVSVGENEISYLKYAAEKLKEISPEQAIICGIVVNLHSDNPTRDDGKRVITIRYKHGEYGNINVKIELGVNQYLLAIEAHKYGKNIEAIGLLERKGSTWSLEAVSDVKIKEDDECC
ncbi:MAG: hypothetical protein CDV28_11150 [Candidatus Electronema aureum]|uniref:Uncharacterized protein n=1 Tax=Candidatus Electronema aureum TaxID=2005002 RepID=A0A521G280_9BACT|nr:MAG: hypothetical protein CDV28_11150 [Candidatus Electronema aureum]